MLIKNFFRIRTMKLPHTWKHIIKCYIIPIYCFICLPVLFQVFDKFPSSAIVQEVTEFNRSSFNLGNGIPYSLINFLSREMREGINTFKLSENERPKFFSSIIEFGKLPFFAGAVPIKPMLNDDLNENCKQDSKWQNIDKTFDNFIHLQE